MPEIRVSKSKVPIVWLDTSILTKICIWKESPDKLERPIREVTRRLYEQIYRCGRKGKLICPLADQEGEVWVNRSKWMRTVHELSLGIECVGEKEIQDKQSYKAMQAYVGGKQYIDLSYEDVFHCDPVEEMNEILRQPVFVAVDYDILFGSQYQKRKKQELLVALNRQRECNVRNRVTYDNQVKAEEQGYVRTIFQMARDLLEGKAHDQEEKFNAWGALVSVTSQFNAWKAIAGDRDLQQLLAFYRSDYYRVCPYNLLTARLFAKVMVDPQPIRSGDPMDITHIATLMPYCDLFITDKAWSTFVNQRKLALPYQTSVCYFGDSDITEHFFASRC
jgi:hypothetical protein